MAGCGTVMMMTHMHRLRRLVEDSGHFPRSSILLATLVFGVIGGPGMAEEGQAPLELETKITLGAVRGRIDHLDVDLPRKHLLIAELENNSVGIVDLVGGVLLHQIAGLNEPQGVGYVASVDMLFVANGGDGTVRIFKGGDFTPTGRQALDSDADNIRVDAETAQVYVGYGAGALAVIDSARGMKIKDIELPAHPESFQISRSTRQIFVNLPNAGSIVVLGKESNSPRITWRTSDAQGNFAMALDEENSSVVVAFRSPPKFSVRDMRDGAVIADRNTCGDVDDVFIDSKRQRLYVICGEGFIDVFDTRPDYRQIGRIPTRRGARTSLFIPTLDRLAVALRASGNEPAEVWIYRPVP
jgi:hypothetical protein